MPPCSVVCGDGAEAPGDRAKVCGDRLKVSGDMAKVCGDRLKVSTDYCGQEWETHKLAPVFC